MNPPNWETFGSYSLSTYQKLEVEEQYRRAAPIIAFRNEEPAQARKREEGVWFTHWRRGISGAFKSWAKGSRTELIRMITRTAWAFGVSRFVAQGASLPLHTRPSFTHISFTCYCCLSLELDETAATDKYIAGRIKAVLQHLKGRRTEAERQDYHVILSSIAPEENNIDPLHSAGMIGKVASRLGLKRNIRKSGQRRPFMQAIARRRAFDARTGATFKGLSVGDIALSRGRLCTIHELCIDTCSGDGTCSLMFEAGGISVVKKYDSLKKKGARLHPLLPSLRPNPLTVRRDAKAEEARPYVVELCESEGARSPSMRDAVQRRSTTYVYEQQQALYLYARYESLHKLYLSRYHIPIGLTLFKRLVPWYVRRAKQMTCLCSHCENFKSYNGALNDLHKLFEPVVTNGLVSEDVLDDDDENPEEAEDNVAQENEWGGFPHLQRLLHFARCSSKSDMVKDVLCKDAFLGAGKDACINGSCNKCGFAVKVWSNLRAHVIDVDGNVRDDAPPEFQSVVSWSRASKIKPTATEANEHVKVMQCIPQLHTCSFCSLLIHNFDSQLVACRYPGMSSRVQR